MRLPDYRTLYPKPGETADSYCYRLESDGHEKMFIRKALMTHFSMQREEFGKFFEAFEAARLCHITMIFRIQKNNRPDMFLRKVAGNLGISTEQANYWVSRFKEGGELDYLGSQSILQET